MLGQSFGPTLLMDQLGAQGPTGSHQAFQRLFTTSASWRSKPVPGHPVDDWVTGLPVVPAMSCHVQPFLGSSGFIFPHFSQAIFGRTSSLVSSIGQTRFKKDVAAVTASGLWIKMPGPHPLSSLNYLDLFGFRSYLVFI